MKVIANFQTEPKIDYTKLDKLHITNESVGKNPQDLDNKEFKNFIEKSKDQKVGDNIVLEMDKKIKLAKAGNKIPEEEIAYFNIFPSPFLLKFSEGDVESDIPVINVYGIQKGAGKFEKHKNKILCFTPDVILIRSFSNIYERKIFEKIYSLLKKMGVQVEAYGNDFEINGKKISGSISESFLDYHSYEELMLTFYCDDKYFKNLGEPYYSRSYIDKNNDNTGISGITGILNEYPDFDVNLFLTELIKMV